MDETTVKGTVRVLINKIPYTIRKNKTIEDYATKTVNYSIESYIDADHSDKFKQRLIDKLKRELLLHTNILGYALRYEITTEGFFLTSKPATKTNKFMIHAQVVYSKWK